MRSRLHYFSRVLFSGLIFGVLVSATLFHTDLSSFLSGSLFRFPDENSQSSFVSGSDSVAPVFEKNIGQYEDDELFRVGKGARQVGFHPNLVRFEMQIDSERSQGEVVFDQSFVGARKNVMPIGDGLLPGKFNYLRGKNEESFTDIPLYESVRYEDLYPGIDLEYLSVGNSLKYQYELEAGVSPDLIQAEYSAQIFSGDVSGLIALEIQEDGSLKIEAHGVTFLKELLIPIR